MNQKFAPLYIGSAILIALSGTTGCNSASAKGQEEGLGTVNSAITLPNGTDLTKINVDLNCTGVGAPLDYNANLDVRKNSSNKAVAGFTNGGLPLTDVCVLTVTATDSYGTANGIENCHATVPNIHPGRGSGGVVNVNLVCADGSAATNADQTGHVTTDITVTTTNGLPYVCNGLTYLAANQYEVSVADQTVINLDYATGGSSWATTESNTWTSSDPLASWSVDWINVWGPGPVTVTELDSHNLHMICNSVGAQTITLTVHDTQPGLLFNGIPGSCQPVTDTFDIECQP